MVVREILSSAQGLFSSVRDGWSEASLVVRTAAVATPVFIVTGTIYLVCFRPLPKKTVKVEPEVPKEKQEEEEEDEGVQEKCIRVVIVDGCMQIISVDLKALGIDEDDSSSSDDEGMEWVDCDGSCMEFRDLITEDPVQSSSLLPAMDDLFVRKEALAELEQQAGELISKLLEAVGSDTGNKPKPILEALSRLSKAGEPLIARMIDEGISFDMSRFRDWVGKVTKLLESNTEKPDVKVDPKWGKKLDARLRRSLKHNHSRLQYVWSGIIGTWYKTSVFNVRVPLIRKAVSTVVSSEKEAAKYLAKQAQRHTPLAELLTCNPEAVKEVFQELFDLGLCLFDAITNTLYDHQNHEIFDLFWDNRAALYEEAGEGKSELMTQILNDALAKANLSPLKEVLK